MNTLVESIRLHLHLLVPEIPLFYIRFLRSRRGGGEGGLGKATTGKI